MSAIIPKDHKYASALQIAQRAVHLATLATVHVSEHLQLGTTFKSDASPVTIADFAAQALIICAIDSAHKNENVADQDSQAQQIGFIAEEAADALREDEALCEAVWDVVNHVRQTHVKYKSLATLQLPLSIDEMLTYIDKGSPSGEKNTGQGRLWVLDPVDGTKTFMRGHQYAVCLCLVEDERQQVAVLGCPNLGIDMSGSQAVLDGEVVVEEEVVDESHEGALVMAVSGHGSWVCKIQDYTEENGKGAGIKQLPRRPSTQGSQIRFTDSKDSSHVRLDLHQQVYKKFGVEDGIVHDIWSMQMKYICLALGYIDATVRIPPDPEYRASVWDHAGGQLIYAEVGGEITDLKGRKFQVNLGRKLKQNWGLIAANVSLHQQLLDEVSNVLQSY